jgi:hypothetical protein
MDKKAKKKPMFVIKETLVHLTPEEVRQIQGGGGCLANPATCVYTG